jgi:hypothetical protein
MRDSDLKVIALGLTRSAPDDSAQAEHFEMEAARHRALVSLEDSLLKTDLYPTLIACWPDEAVAAARPERLENGDWTVAGFGQRIGLYPTRRMAARAAGRLRYRVVECLAVGVRLSTRDWLNMAESVCHQTMGKHASPFPMPDSVLEAWSPGSRHPAEVAARRFLGAAQ